MANKLKVGDKARLVSDMGIPYKNLAGHPCKVLSMNAGTGGKYIYAEVLHLAKGKVKRERYLFHPEQVVKERNSGVLALWKELEASQKKLAKISSALEKVVDWE